VNSCPIAIFDGRNKAKANFEFHEVLTDFVGLSLPFSPQLTPVTHVVTLNVQWVAVWGWLPLS
jgi:hypothetical protein